MSKRVNRAKMTTTTLGTGTITLGSAASGFQTFAAAGVVNADVVRYVIEEGTAWEIGNGTYTATGTTLARSLLSSSTGSLLSLGGNAVVYVTGTAEDFNELAPLASPALTGTPTAPTAALNTNTTQLATTQFVLNQANDTAATIAMNGTQAAGTSELYARADHVHPTDTSRSPLASPTFTGTPAAPTAAVGTNTTQIATTAFVNAEIANDAPTKTGGGASGTWDINITGNAATATDSTKLPLAGGTVTGDITMSGTGFLDVPVGTTLQRPGTPSAGMIRFNTTRSCFEGYNGTGWVNLSPINFDDIGAIA